MQEKAIAEVEKRLGEQGASREEEEEEETRTTVNRTLINTSVRAFPSEMKAALSSGLASLKTRMGWERSRDVRIYQILAILCWNVRLVLLLWVRLGVSVPPDIPRCWPWLCAAQPSVPVLLCLSPNLFCFCVSVFAGHGEGGGSRCR